MTRYEPDAAAIYESFARFIAARHSDTLFSSDGSTVDQQVAAMLRETQRTIATAESCTGGLLAARLTELPGSSDYFKGSVVAYANEVKVGLAGAAAELIEDFGAVSAEVAEALARGAERVGTDVGVGVTGVAGPGGGSQEKPVGLVWVSVVGAVGEPLTRSLNLPGGRADAQTIAPPPSPCISCVDCLRMRKPRR